MRSAGVILAYSRNFCSTDLASAGLAVRVVADFCVSKRDAGNAEIEIDMANSGSDFTESSKGHAKRERPKMSFYVGLRRPKPRKICRTMRRPGKPCREECSTMAR